MNIKPFEKLLLNATKEPFCEYATSVSKPIIRNLEGEFKLATEVIGDTCHFTHYGKGLNSKLNPEIISARKQQADRLNEIATQRIKAGKVEMEYAKASAQDLKRLTSEAIEDSYSRVEWVNPKDGKIYNLLKQGETEDGKVIVRILDEEGAFVKEAVLTPKKVAIVDNLNSIRTELHLRDDLYHGEKVLAFAQRNNPFVKYELINVNYGVDNVSKDAASIIENSLKNKRFDYISVSLGKDVSIEGKTLAEQKKLITSKPNDIRNILLQQSDNGTRVLVASGNYGKDSVATELIAPIEGVGALGTNGEIAEYSASRSFTQHYELGDYKRQYIYDADGGRIGMNITGIPGMDFKFSFKRELTRDEIAQLKNLQEEEKLLKEKYNIQPWMFDMYGWEIPKPVKDIINKIKDFTAGTKFSAERTFNEDWDNKIYDTISGTSFSTPIRVAKCALDDMMNGVI